MIYSVIYLIVCIGYVWYDYKNQETFGYLIQQDILESCLKLVLIHLFVIGFGAVSYFIYRLTE